MNASSPSESSLVPRAGAAVVLTLAVSFAGLNGADTANPRAPVATGSAAEPEAVPETPARLTLDDAVALAMEFSPALAGSSWQVQTAEGLALQADKIPNPEIELRLSRIGESSGDEDVARRRVIVRQDLELGGKRGRRVDLAQVDSRLADWSYRTGRTEVAATVTMRFVEVLAAQRRVELCRELIDYIERVHAASARMTETGSLGVVEMQTIVQRRGQARIESRRAENALETARFDLAAVWGSASPGFDEAVGSLEPVGSIPSIDIVLEMAKAGPQTERWDAELERSRAALSLARAGAVPDLGVGVGVAWQEGSAPPDYLLELEIDLPFFDRNQGDIRAAQSELQRTEALRRAAEAADAGLVANLYYEMTESAARASILADEVIPAARAAVETLRLTFEGQPEGLADLLDSRRDLTEVEIERTDALVAYRRSLAELEHLIGRSVIASPGE